jgi:hypothetical protein
MQGLKKSFKLFLIDLLLFQLPCKMSKAKGVRLHIHVMVLVVVAVLIAACFYAWNSLRMLWKSIRYPL